jgi:hypothetical protein
VGRHSSQSDGSGAPALPHGPDEAFTVVLPVVPEEPGTGRREHGRFSPLAVALVTVAVGAFVAGAAWAVTGPARSAGTAPESVASAGLLGGAGQPAGNVARTGTKPPAGTPARTTPGRTASPSVSGAGASAAAAPAGSPSAVAVSVASSPPRTFAPAVGPSAVAAVSVWDPNGALVSVRVTAGSAGLTGWQATVTCQPGFDTGSIGLWNASRVGAGSGNGGSWLTVRNLDYNGAVAPGATVVFGFTAGRTGSGAFSCTVSVAAR